MIRFVEDAYLFSENLLSFIETATTKHNEVVVKASFFQDKAIAVILDNKNEVDCIILTLYNRLMQIRKEKGLTAYHHVDLVLF